MRIYAQFQTGTIDEFDPKGCMLVDVTLMPVIRPWQATTTPLGAMERQPQHEPGENQGLRSSLAMEKSEHGSLGGDPRL